MNRKTLILLLSCCLGTMVALAADGQYIIEIKPSKKVLHVDKLGLGESTPILDVLQSMPELIERRAADGSILTNYSIQIDGKSVGQSRDVVLQQTIVAEVDVIEVSTSPTVSEQKNGTGGVINIKLKPVGKEGASGLAILDVATEWDVAPSVLVNYKKDKFILRSSVRAEYYRPTDIGCSYLHGPNELMESYDTTRSSYKQATAKLYMEYKPTSRDELKVNMWESYSRMHSWANQTNLVMQADQPGSLVYRKNEQFTTSDVREETLTAEAFAGYKHLYGSHKGELVIEAQYSYMPTQKVNSFWQSGVKGLFGGDTWTMNDQWKKAHQVEGEVASKHVVYKAEKDMVDLKCGMNASYMFGPTYSALRQTLITRVVNADTTHTDNGNIYASPYLEMNYEHGVWALQAGARYQYYRVNLQDVRTPKSFTDDHTFTGNVSLRCNVAKDHLLRLNLARNIQRNIAVDAIQIYPYYDADLIYIFDWQNHGHGITTSVGANYIYAQQTEGFTGTACANAQLIYQYNIFSMAFAGNAYVRTPYGNAYAGKRYWYYNLSLVPVLSFSKQWILSGQFVYNSKIQTYNELYGDCFYAQIRVAKQIRGWNIHLEINDIFDYLTYNTFYLDDGTSYRNLDDVYPRSLTIGFSYTF